MSDTRLLTAFFDSSAAARTAMDDLVAAGVPRTQINLIEGEGSAPTGATSYEGTGFWESLKNLFVPDEDRYTYAEGLRRGGFLLSIRVDASSYDTALNILDREGAVNIDERATTWREQGWVGRSGGLDTGYGSSTAGALGAAPAPGLSTSSEVEREMSSTRASNPSTEAEKTIPVAEERLRVGKREEGRGRVRVRSYVEEVPVQENVTLRDRNVTVEHRPVQAGSAAAEDAFKDRTIEAVESREEPVVSKEARVVEEVVLRESENTRDETVSDSVRKTRVEVEDDRKGRGTGTSE